MTFNGTLDYQGVIELVGIALTIISGGFAFLIRIETRFAKIETQLSQISQFLGHAKEPAE